MPVMTCALVERLQTIGDPRCQSENLKHPLNRTKRDWHSDTQADRSRVVRLLQRSARSFCAANYDSGDSPSRASPHAG